MSGLDSSDQILSSFCFSIIAKRTTRIFSVLVLFIAGFSCLAQQSRSQPTGQESISQRTEVQGPAQPSTTLILPAGTKIALVLTHAIQSRRIRRGDDIYAQISFPVSSGDEVGIPAGVFVQGKVDKITGNAERAELHLRSMSLTFPNGYVALISGPLTLESNGGYALKDPSGGQIAAAIAMPAAGLGLGALIGHAAGGKGTNINGMQFNPGGLQATAIGSMVGLAAGGVGSLVLLTRSREFFLYEGSPLEVVLQHSVSLDRNRIMDAVSYSNSHPVQAVTTGNTYPAQTIPPRVVIGNAGQLPGDCVTGQQWCGGRCMDTIAFVSDAANCGRCGNRCSFSEQCTGGSCMCGPTYTMCMGSCVSDSSLLTDSNNCGRCGNHCSFGESCMGGTCTKTVP